MHKLISFLICLLFSISGFTQTVINKAETNSTPVMEENGKIYVVLAVCLVVLTGIFIFIRSLEKRISRLEKQKE
jgi:flagellar biosynthesis/type III secretory pathway M-ring protein FliF/YscJ